MLARLALLAALLASLVPCARALGKTSWELQLDPYYTALGWEVPFRKEGIQNHVEQSEIKTYHELLRQSLTPSFMVLEGSVNPAPCAGAFLRKNYPNFYHTAQLSPTINLVEALSAGFDEPYALSLFLGKIVDFSSGQRRFGSSRKGYVGYLASYGNYHLMNNLVIPDNWLELEWKVKGDQQTEARKMSWGLRAGRRFHSNREVRDAYHFAVRRNRADFKKGPYSFLLSSAIEYRLNLDYETLTPTHHYILIEKNFPIPRYKCTLSVGLGYVWYGRDRYQGSLAERRRKSPSQILLQPNIRF